MELILNHSNASLINNSAHRQIFVYPIFLTSTDQITFSDRVPYNTADLRDRFALDFVLSLPSSSVRCGRHIVRDCALIARHNYQDWYRDSQVIVVLQLLLRG